jgi:hypothetical protein
VAPLDRLAAFGPAQGAFITSSRWSSRDDAVCLRLLAWFRAGRKFDSATGREPTPLHDVGTFDIPEFAHVSWRCLAGAGQLGAKLAEARRCSAERA